VLARRWPGDELLLVDLAGDLPAVLGLPEGGGTGVADWLAAGDTVGADALRRLEVEVGGIGGVRLLPRGTRPNVDDGGSSARLLGALTEGLPAGVEGARPVVVDCGRVSDSATSLAVAAGASLSMLVLRPCYLALRRAVEAPIRPSGVVLVDEPGRALGPADVEDTLGVPVRAVIPWRADIARAVDAGLLTSRLPRSLCHALARAAA
jgi:hypothetical protein